MEKKPLLDFRAMTAFDYTISILFRVVWSTSSVSRWLSKTSFAYCSDKPFNHFLMTMTSRNKKKNVIVFQSNGPCYSASSQHPKNHLRGKTMTTVASYGVDGEMLYMVFRDFQTEDDKNLTM